MTIELNQEYQWNHGFANPIAHTDIRPIIKELKEIEDVRGEITPEYVVESAQNKSSVLHSYFIWDDAKAAHKYRIIKATELLGRIEIKVLKDGEIKILRAFEITKREANISSYNHIDSGSSSSSRNTIICINELSRVINRLEPYPEFSKALVLIKKAVDLISKVSTETRKEQPKELSVA